MSHPGRTSAQASLDLVQRVILSITVCGFVGSFAIGFAAYLALRGHLDLPRDSVIGLWTVTGLTGVIAVIATLVINRRRVLSPWLLVGLLPMVVSGWWIL
ncbi:hypothetical protein ACF3NT_12465 [Naumannella halotolerans]|uniref:Uncharacterized protein n=1 Tax=Naumannella halotolerans TaxID=993414 RepID=A0A4R7J1Q8_9ACTN|nr:hypothetical protein [Naumannella halotolerans]TDT31050.1 hypothetical protein CLV29_2462 [Naumannella halotolerans]